MTHRILVIEEDEDTARLIEPHLKNAGYEVSLARDGHTGLDTALSNPWDLIILNLTLPGIDALEICRRVRNASDYVPMLMLTSKSTVLDRVLGLEMGADDYITKPFSVPEFIARVKALIRRAEALKCDESKESQKVIQAGDLVVDAEKCKVTLKGNLVSLTAKEFDLLLHFAGHPGRVYTRVELLNLVWGYDYDGYQHTVNSHINRLRAKIEENPARPRFILSVRGVGYKFGDLQDLQKSTLSSG